LASCGLERQARLGAALRGRIQRGNRGAFDEIYAAFAPALYAQVLLPRLGSAFAAEDALAETFRAALEKLGDFRPQGGSLFGWLARIAVNKATDLHRERTRTGKALASFESLVAPLREVDLAAGLEADRTLDQRRLRAAVDEVLGAFRRGTGAPSSCGCSRTAAARRVRATDGNHHPGTSTCCCCARCGRSGASGSCNTARAGGAMTDEERPPTPAELREAELLAARAGGALPAWTRAHVGRRRPGRRISPQGVEASGVGRSCGHEPCGSASGGKGPGRAGLARRRLGLRESRRLR